jgi:hypothetical protein
MLITISGWESCSVFTIIFSMQPLTGIVWNIRQCFTEALRSKYNDPLPTYQGNAWLMKEDLIIGLIYTPILGLKMMNSSNMKASMA